MTGTVSCYVGSVLSGPRPGTPAPTASPAEALAIDVTARLLPGPPPRDVLQPIASGRVFFVNSRQEQPLRVGAPPFAGARGASGSEARAFLAGTGEATSAGTDLGSFPSVLPIGFTSVFTFQAGTGGPPIALLVSRSPALEMGLTAGEDLVALAWHPEPDRGPAVVVLPVPDAGRTPATLVLTLEVLPAPADPAGAARHAERLAACVGSVPPAPPPPSVTAHAAELERLWLGVQKPAERRAALLYIATASGARLVEELVLQAEDEWLEKLVGEKGSGPFSAAEKGPDPFSPPGADPLAAAGAELERRALQMMAEAIRQETLPAHFEACLLRRAGAVARSAAILEAAAAQPDLAAIDARLVAENLSMLEEPTAGARARAHEWLAARGAAPEGFDPFGPAPERRAALERAYAEKPR
jgi:hypothetical protein